MNFIGVAKKSWVPIIFLVLALLGEFPAMASSNGIDDVTNDAKAVAMKWADLLDDNKLPGMSANDHGKLTAFQLTKNMEKLLLDKKSVTTNMLNSINRYNNHDNCWVAAVITTDNRNFAYFFCVANSNVQLVSSYLWKTNGWVKIER